MKQSFSKAIYVLLFSSLLTFLCSAQNDYTVLKVYGTITYKKLDRELAKGDQFKDKDVLIFKTTESRAAVISPEKGRLMITKSNSNDASGMNFVPGLSNISTRGGSINTLMDLENEFAGEYLLLNIAKINVGKTNFPQNEESFFYIKYKYNNEEINKKLAFSGDTLIINVNELLQVDGKPIQLGETSDMKLYYLKDKNSTLICDFIAIFPDKKALLNEITIILNTYTNKESKYLYNEIKSYITEFYGKPNDFDLRNWLKVNLNFE